MYPTHILLGYRYELKQLQLVSIEQHNDCHITEVVVETPPCVSKAKDWEALWISLDSYFDETSGAVSVSEEIVLQKNKKGRCRICTSDNKIHRYMPYKINYRINDETKANQSHKY